MKPAAAILITSMVAVLLCAGCMEPDTLTPKLQKQLQASQAREKQLTAQVEKLVAHSDEQDKQIATLRKLGPDRLGKLFVVDRIKLGRYTGGIDTDKKPGQDAIKVIVKPYDRAGSIIKAAGEIKIQLFDLGAPKAERLIAEFIYPVEKIGKHWSSGFMSYHYSFDCLWPSPPKNPDITVRAEFTDYLTGKTFSDQKLIKITLPPAQ